MQDNECFDLIEKHITLLQATLDTAKLMANALRSRRLLEREPEVDDYSALWKNVTLWTAVDIGGGGVYCRGYRVETEFMGDFLVTDMNSAMAVVDYLEKESSRK